MNGAVSRAPAWQRTTPRRGGALRCIWGTRTIPIEPMKQ
jgi:hypothetical protein